MVNFEELLSSVHSAEIAVLDREKEVIEAKKEFLMWKHQDYFREDGSGAQDARHEEFGSKAERRLFEAKNKLKDAKNQLEDAKKMLVANY